MPQVEPVKRQPKKLPLVVGGAVLLIVVVVAGVVVMKELTKSTVAQTETAQKQALLDSFKGNHAAATQTLQQQLRQAKTDDEKLDLYMAMGQNHMMAKDYKAAVVVYREAAKLRPGYGTNEAIAKSAELAGDKAVALDYFQRNRKLIQDGKAGLRAGDLERVEAAIKRLGGSL